MSRTRKAGSSRANWFLVSTTANITQLLNYYARFIVYITNSDLLTIVRKNYNLHPSHLIQIYLYIIIIKISLIVAYLYYLKSITHYWVIAQCVMLINSRFG